MNSDKFFQIIPGITPDPNELIEAILNLGQKDIKPEELSMNGQGSGTTQINME